MGIGEKQPGFLHGIWGGGQHGMVAGGMEAKDHLGLGWFFNAQALRADGHATVAADLAGREAELGGGLAGTERVLPEGGEHVADK